jgi:hypothetical protein
VKELAKRVISGPLSLATTVPMPSAIAAVLREASLAAVEQVEDAMHNNNISSSTSNGKKNTKNISMKNFENESSREMIESIIEEAFAPMEKSLLDMETSLQKARESLEIAKLQSYQAMEALQMAAMAEAVGAATAVARVEKEAQRQVMAEIYSNAVGGDQGGTVDISKLTFDDVDYESSEMAPPFLDPDSCLIPGEPVVRLEKAPENSRRIFAGIDILASVDDVWKVI